MRLLIAGFLVQVQARELSLPVAARDGERAGVPPSTVAVVQHARGVAAWGDLVRPPRVARPAGRCDASHAWPCGSRRSVWCWRPAGRRSPTAVGPAVRYHRLGRLFERNRSRGDAEAAYRRALAQEPSYAASRKRLVAPARASGAVGGRGRGPGSGARARRPLGEGLGAAGAAARAVARRGGGRAGVPRCARAVTRGARGALPPGAPAGAPGPVGGRRRGARGRGRARRPVGAGRGAARPAARAAPRLACRRAGVPRRPGA